MFTKLRIRPLGRKILITQGICFGICAGEYLIYYHFLRNAVEQNFTNSPFKTSDLMKDQVVIVDGETTFAFKHRGGNPAAQSVVRDTFDNNRCFSRALVYQFFSTMAVTMAFVKQREKWMRMITWLVAGNVIHLIPVAISGSRLHNLSFEVKKGNMEVWENLNEYRYIQRMDEIFSPKFRYPRIVGALMIVSGIIYGIPAVGSALGLIMLSQDLLNKVN